MSQEEACRVEVVSRARPPQACRFPKFLTDRVFHRPSWERDHAYRACRRRLSEPPGLGLAPTVPSVMVSRPKSRADHRVVSATFSSSFAWQEPTKKGRKPAPENT